MMLDDIQRLKLENIELRERLNAICTFLSMKFEDSMDWINISGMNGDNHDFLRKAKNCA